MYVNEWGTFIYNSGVKYGPNAETFVHPHWAIQVAWNGDYSGFDDTFNNEAFRAVKVTVRRGTQDYLSRLTSGVVDVGSATIELDNSDGRYDPWNTSSPLYPYVQPGKFARVWLWEPYDDEPYYLIRGIVSDIVPAGRDRVFIQIKDGLSWLAEQIVSSELADNRKYKDWVTYILLAAGWPQSEWGITTAGTGEVAATEWAWNVNALNYIRKLATAEVGLFWHASNGYAKFYTRDYAQSSVATITEEMCLNDISVRSYWDFIRNVVQVNAYWWKYLDVADVLWNLDEQGVSIPHGETKTFLAEFKYNGQEIGALNLSTNLEVNTAPDGSGADITASCSVGTGDDGGGTVVTLTNNHATDDGYIIELSVEGEGYYSPFKTGIQESDSDSIADYGRKSLLIDSPCQHDPGDSGATWIAEDLLSELKDPQPLPVFRLQDRLETQFALDVFSKIKVEFPSKGIDDYFRMGYIEHEWLLPTGFSFQTTVYCEPYFELRIL